MGNRFTPPGLRYAARDFTGHIISESIDPTAEAFVLEVNPNNPPGSPVPGGGLWQRPSAGLAKPATRGMAFYTPKGALCLAWINEVMEQEACEEATGQEICEASGGTWNGTECEFDPPIPGQGDNFGDGSGQSGFLGGSGGQSSTHNAHPGPPPTDDEDPGDPDCSADPWNGDPGPEGHNRDDRYC